MLRNLTFFLLAILPISAQTYIESQVVNTQIQRPDGGGLFYPVGNPSIEGSNAVFFTLVQPTNLIDALWAANIDTGAFTKLADTATPAPGGTGNFSGFSYGPKDQLEPELRGGTVVFYGLDSTNTLGLYTIPVTGGAIHQIARTNGACPSGGTFTFLDLQSFNENYSIDGGKILFNAQCSGKPGYGVYVANIDGTGLATVVDPGLMITDAPRKITYGGWQNAPLSNGQTAVTGGNGFDPSRGPNALYAASITGGVQTSAPVIDDTLPLPATDPHSPTHWEIGQYEISGTQMAFTGFDSSAGSPVYTAIFITNNVPGGGSLTRIADIASPLPGVTKLPVIAFDRLSYIDGSLAFGAYGNDNLHNVYLANGGNIVLAGRSSVDVNDMPGGFYTYNLWPLNRYSQSGGRVVFRVSNQVAGAIMLASPVSTATTITGVANSASYLSTSVAPGEIVTIYGTNLGPAGPGPGGSTSFSLGANGRVPTLLAGTRVLVNGIPAPLIYVSPTQLSAIVPYEFLTSQPAQAFFQVEYQGAFSAGFSVPVTTEAPGLFSYDSSGSGGAAIINQDGSVNTPSNPAAAGDSISLYGTGDGEEDPIPVTGGVNPAGLTNSLHFLYVTIGGIRAQVSYRGGAPSAVSGLLQINVVVPAGLTPGNQPVVAQYDSVFTQPNLTVAVK